MNDDDISTEELAFEIATELCEELGGNYHVADWVIVDDSAIGFVALLMKSGRYKVKFFKSFDSVGGYYSTDFLPNMASSAIPYIEQLLIDNNFTVITQDDPEKMLYRSLLVKKENQNDNP